MRIDQAVITSQLSQIGLSNLVSEQSAKLVTIAAVGSSVAGYVDTPIVKKCGTCIHLEKGKFCNEPHIGKDPQVPVDKKTGYKEVSASDGCCNYWDPGKEVKAGGPGSGRHEENGTKKNKFLSERKPGKSMKEADRKLTNRGYVKIGSIDLGRGIGYAYRNSSGQKASVLHDPVLNTSKIYIHKKGV